MDDWLPQLGSRPRLLVLTFPVADTSALVTRRLRELDPELVVIARSPYLAQADELGAAGARFVLCDERETARALEPMLLEALRVAGASPRQMEQTRETLTGRIDKRPPTT
jgi:hypothetical protein